MRKILSMILAFALCLSLCTAIAPEALSATNYDLYTFRVWVTADGHSTGSSIGKADSWHVFNTYGVGTANGTQLRLKAIENDQYYIQAWYSRGGYWTTLYIFDGSGIGSGSGFVSGFDTSGGKYYISGSGPDNVSVAKWTLKNGSFYTKVGSTEYVLYIDYNEKWGEWPFRLSTNKNHPQRVNYNAMTLSPHSHTEGTPAQQNKVAATCTTDGSYVQVVKCSGCGIEMSRSTITVPAKGHSWAAATCIVPKTCSVCGATEGEALGHTWVDADCDTPKTCSVCSATEGEALGHTWAAATCTAPKTCTVCGETEGEALGHTEEVIPAVPATCTSTGWTEGRYCLICEEDLVEQEWIPMADHTCIVTREEPTCTQDGSTTERCSNCPYEDTTVLPKLGHDYEAEVTAPTCTTGGYTTHTCTRCGDNYQDTPVDALGHNMGEWQTVKAPTCTEAGSQARSCGSCSHTETESLSELGHDYKAEVTAPTCTEGGYTTHACVRGDDTYQDTSVDALGHSMGEWQTVKAPTCTEAGNQARSCVNCSHTETEPLPELGHSMGEWTYSKAPTCIREGKEIRSCQNCSYSETRTAAALGHDYEDQVKGPTCTKQGNTTHTCTRCGDIYIDSYLPKLGHDYEAEVTAPTCTTGGYTTHTCTRCGDNYQDTPVDALGHSMGEWQQTLAPTYTAAGAEKRTCTHDSCEEYEERSIPATGPALVENITVAYDAQTGTLKLENVPVDITVMIARYLKGRMVLAETDFERAGETVIFRNIPADGDEMKIFFLTEGYCPIADCITR